LILLVSNHFVDHITSHVSALPALEIDVPLHSIASNEAWTIVIKFFAPGIVFETFCRGQSDLLDDKVNLVQDRMGWSLFQT
jgi:hypothetical protein